MKRLCILTLLLICAGAVAEIGWGLGTQFTGTLVSAELPWRYMLMIALPLVGIYGRRRHGR